MAGMASLTLRPATIESVTFIASVEAISFSTHVSSLLDPLTSSCCMRLRQTVHFSPGQTGELAATSPVQGESLSLSLFFSGIIKI